MKFKFSFNHLKNLTFSDTKILFESVLKSHKKMKLCLITLITFFEIQSNALTLFQPVTLFGIRPLISMKSYDVENSMDKALSASKSHGETLQEVKLSLDSNEDDKR